jgi:hypothetical protein
VVAEAITARCSMGDTDGRVIPTRSIRAAGELFVAGELIDWDRARGIPRRVRRHRVADGRSALSISTRRMAGSGSAREVDPLEFDVDAPADPRRHALHRGEARGGLAAGWDITSHAHRRSTPSAG